MEKKLIKVINKGFMLRSICVYNGQEYKISELGLEQLVQGENYIGWHLAIHWSNVDLRRIK